MNLIAYQLHDRTEFLLEPADARRAWMDESPNQFAYRCLPLTIANQAGWIIRTPVSFEVTWNGSGIPYEEMAFSPEVADSYLSRHILGHFGSGVVTFSIPYLFRTEPGYGLLVRGAPNFWVPNAHPLEGYVETDWIESTFTMNWRIVEPDRPTRFNAGDPICFLQPYPLALLEGTHPMLIPLDENQALKEQLARWGQKRREFISQEERRPQDWQKDYFLGRSVDGEAQPQHRTRLHLKRFEPHSADA